MIICPNCHHQEITGALFCSECGAQLVLIEHINTQLIGRKVHGADSTPPDSNPLSGRRTPDDATGISISLYLVDSGQILHLMNRMEYSLGRMAEGQPIMPDVDFSPYDAYTQGVSRLHATLKLIEQKLVVTDLGSSNGTRVNGQKIMPHIDYPVEHGDVVTLGRLKVQILIRIEEEKG